ncbi:hypothetical protein PO883_33590 [Massilia sp. DJPM01]|nr:hypothetical protein [Massilia sp. DJPM01]MDM5182107.1 hypothetical protein [Massilia sp. DJPM01]
MPNDIRWVNPAFLAALAASVAQQRLRGQHRIEHMTDGAPF